MRYILPHLLLSMLLFSPLVGCDSGEIDGGAALTAEEPSPPVIGGGPPVIGGGASVGADDPAETAAVQPPEIPYPEAPYGKTNFDTIENLAFFDPYTVQWRTFADLYNNSAVKMVIVSSSAGWCPACKTEAEHLVGYYDEYQADGLEVYFTLFEDDQGLPMIVDNQVTSAAMAVMATWKADYGIDYPFLIDVQSSLREYQIDGGVPLTMVITTDDMMIRYIDEGYSSAFIENKILHYLYNN